MLCPVIRRPVPSDILQKLQDNFHKLIHAEVGRRVVDEKLYLPLLEVLMELNGDTIWFPVKFQYEAAVRINENLNFVCIVYFANFAFLGLLVPAPWKGLASKVSEHSEA